MARCPAELRGEKRLDEVPGYFRANRASAHTDDLHIIVLDALLGREMIVDETGVNAFNLVGAHRRADAAAADRDAAIDVTSEHRSCERYDVVRIVVARVQAMGTEINHLIPCRADLANQFFLQAISAVIRGNSYTHANYFPRKMSV